MFSLSKLDPRYHDLDRNEHGLRSPVAAMMM